MPVPLLRRLLPEPADRKAAKVLAFVALAPLLCLLLAWWIPSSASAELRWRVQAHRWPPYPVEGEPVSLTSRFGKLSWYRMSQGKVPADPWARSYYVDTVFTSDATVVSPGPDGVFEGGDGDDVQVEGAFFLGVGFFMILAGIGGLVFGVVGTVLYVAKRQASMPRSPSLGVELTRSAVIALPLVSGTVLVALGVGRIPVARELPFGLVNPAVAVAGTLALVIYLGVLALRMRKGLGSDP